jgi:hypothetical protein
MLEHFRPILRFVLPSLRWRSYPAAHDKKSTTDMPETLEDYRQPPFSGKPTSLVKRALHNRVTYWIEDLFLSMARPVPDIPVNEVEVKVLGMRRSGNHAILTWIMRAANATKPTHENVFLNNCKTRENNYRLQSDFRPPEISDEEFQRIRDRRNRSYRNTGLLLRSLEDFDLDAFRDSENEYSWYGRSRKRADAVIIRDPLNLFASRLKVGYIDTKSALPLIDLYLDNARALEEDSTELPISYNLWLLSQDYRLKILEKLGIDGPDVQDDRPARFGPGSSFQKHDSKLERLALLRRWEEFSQDNWFKREVMGNSELLDITERHFPEVLE